MTDFIEKLKLKANKGDKEAQYNLARIYLSSDDNNKIIEGHYWLKEAAKDNHLQSQYMLGLTYLLGKNIEQNFEQAHFWFKKAAESGHIKSQHQLGLMFLDGDVLEQDIEQAKHWLAKAAEQGNVHSQLNLGLMYLHGNGVIKNKHEAYSWLTKAADQNNSDAQYILGTMHYFGEGLEQDSQNAKVLFELSANQNNADAQLLLGLMYIHDNEIGYDYQNSYHWFSKAANQGNIYAQNIKSIMLYYGIGTSKDEIDGIDIYEKIKHHKINFQPIEVVVENDNEKNIQKYVSYKDKPKETNKNYTLRKVNKNDVQRVYEITNHNELKRILNYNTKTSEETEYFVDLAYLNNNNTSFAIIDKQDKKLIGIINYIVKYRKTILYFYLDYHYWNKEIMSSALKDSLKYVFDNLYFQEIYVKVTVDNIAAIKVLVKNGFTYSGSYKKITTIRNHEDIYEFVLKKEDFIKRKE